MMFEALIQPSFFIKEKKKRTLPALEPEHKGTACPSVHVVARSKVGKEDP